jgi:hypothetical protein
MMSLNLKEDAYVRFQVFIALGDTHCGPLLQYSMLSVVCGFWRNMPHATFVFKVAVQMEVVCSSRM